MNLLSILLVTLCVLSIAGTTFGRTESGYLSGPGASNTFTVEAGSDTLIELLFYYPVGTVDFWVKVVGQDGYTILGDFDLDNGEIIQLMGGGTFYLTVYSKSGGGNWSATDDPMNAGPNPWIEDVTVEAGSNVDVSGDSVSGYLTGPGEECTWSVDVNVYNIDFTFRYPEGYVDFWVEVRNRYGSVVGDYDLDTNRVISLIGEDTYHMTVYSKAGAGKWSCTW
jgi:hypothetical protein